MGDVVDLGAIPPEETVVAAQPAGVAAEAQQPEAGGEVDPTLTTGSASGDSPERLNSDLSSDPSLPDDPSSTSTPTDSAERPALGLVDEHGNPLDPGQAQEPEAPPVVETPVAFVVYLDPQGHWMADNRVNIQFTNLMRAANPVDFSHAARDIEADINAMITTNRIVETQRMMAAQIQQQQQEMAVRQMMAEGKMPPGGMPGGLPGGLFKG